MFKNTFWEFLHINHCGTSWLLFCYSINFWSYEDSSQNTEQTPHDPDPAHERDIQMEYSSD